MVGGRTKGKSYKVIAIVLAAIISVLIIAYIAGAIYYGKHVFAGTYIKELELSNSTASEVEEKLNSLLKDYTLTIKGRDNMSVSLGSSDINLRYKLDDYGNKVIQAQNKWTWVKHLFENQILEGEFELEYDTELLKNVVYGFDFMQPAYIQKPKSAYLSEFIPGKGFEIVPEIMGNKPIEEVLFSTLDLAIKSMNAEVDLDASGCYKNPKVRSDNKKLVKKEKYLNKFLSTNITYKFGEDIVVVDCDRVYEWMKIKDNGKVEILEEKVKAFVNEIGAKYDTIFRSRTFKTSYDNKEVVIGEGDYGWWMNRSAEVSELIKLVKEGAVEERIPVYFQQASQYGKEDYGNTYVEINLTAQHLFLYKEGELVLESDFVSGKDTKDRKTPEGVYGITYKERDATLKGADYETPVSYWMPFNGSIGLHDATWRNKFGSNFYKYGGSHGCINLPFYVAEKIYENIEKGTPVICYYLPGTESNSVTPQDDKEIAQFVVDAIDRIGPVSKERMITLEKFLKRTRQCYKELSSNQKKYVKNIKKLEEAEKKFAELKSGK